MNNEKKKEKILNLISNEENKKYIDEIHNEYNKTVKKFIVKIEGTPIAYARERRGRGSHFYNPKSKLMKECRKDLKSQLSKESSEYLNKLTSNPDAEYYIDLDITYYIEIPNSKSIKDSVKMLCGIKRPGVKPDLDNYSKFILDTMHEIFYDDDKRVVSTKESKNYTLDKPRTEILVVITELNKK